MEKIFLILLLSLSSITTKAQMYYPYPQQGMMYGGRLIIRVRAVQSHPCEEYYERQSSRCCDCECHYRSRQRNCCGHGRCEECYEEEPQVVERVVERYVGDNTVAGWTIGFRIDTYEIDYNNTDANTNIQNIVEFLRNYPDATAHLYGYADRNTGSSQHNMWLSEQRCLTVRRKLVEQYGIASDRITFSYYGSNEQRYSVNNYNRCVFVELRRHGR